MEAIALARAIRSGLAAGGADPGYLHAIEAAFRQAVVDCEYSYSVRA
jgi:hypothetical protein